ncbi:hypothetical protein HDU97_004489 [Phlyctochytrium planicorne]|nr:hypothetical protein HDU97_004489 [Phlyctochytrium planicorne]
MSQTPPPDSPEDEEVGTPEPVDPNEFAWVVDQVDRQTEETKAIWTDMRLHQSRIHLLERTVSDLKRAIRAKNAVDYAKSQRGDFMANRLAKLEALAHQQYLEIQTVKFAIAQDKLMFQNANLLKENNQLKEQLIESLVGQNSEFLREQAGALISFECPLEKAIPQAMPKPTPSPELGQGGCVYGMKFPLAHETDPSRLLQLNQNDSRSISLASLNATPFETISPFSMHLVPPHQSSSASAGLR